MHLRVEHRSLPVAAAPIDNVANAAFFWGLTRGFMELIDKSSARSAEALLPFDRARSNFYAAAEFGLEAKLFFPGDDHPSTLKEKIEYLIDTARNGLTLLGVSVEDSNRYLGVIEARIRSGKTEADWIQDLAQGDGKTLVSQAVRNRIAIAIAVYSSRNVPVHERAACLADCPDSANPPLSE
jgi:hypothetical protein